ncbi:guanylate kinase [Aureibacter tunicatorum]|uniref:Guanylate kinase n=1 Tax=Aureibacter tunicatorum TaxID=866807 RepID=A0AAE3XJ73_9BACT|nr:guanylate kinase [Aureibacter tunicatorum]MDR6237857.1 guanylate kinase [Aureibacter tunicatorum]BDD02892.1 guanylate kinase [Aureibacter tunicatorum]
MSNKGGKAIIFSAPSGSGKTTIVKHLLSTRDDLMFSISACTRDKRGRAEQNGKDYYFLTPDEFKQKIDQDAFVEWEEVYQGNFYGTLKTEIERIWSEGKNVIFDVDVKGGISLKEYFGEDALSIFVKVPDIETLRERLGDRGTDTEDSISQRVFKAKFEMGFEKKFDTTIVNKELDVALADAQNLLDNFLNK